MKKLLAVALVLVMVLGLGSALADVVGEGNQEMTLKVYDERPVFWVWTIPSELDVTFSDGNNSAINSSIQNWKNYCEIKNALIEFGKAVQITKAVTEPLTNSNGDTLKTVLDFNWQYTRAVNGYMLYTGNADKGMKTGLTFYAEGEMSKVFVSDYTGKALFTCEYVNVPNPD